MTHPVLGYGVPVFLLAARGQRLQGQPPPLDGRFVNASNTGLAGIGVDPATLTTQGAITYSTAGQTITGKKFTGRATITGDNITISGCQFVGGDVGATAYIPCRVSGGSNFTIQDCTFTPDTGLAFYIGIDIIGGDGATIQRNDIGTCSNGITLDVGTITNTLIQYNYIHDLTGGDNDCVEVYAGSGVTILNNWLVLSSDSATHDQSSINIAPYRSGIAVDHVLARGNFMDGGNVSVVDAVISPGGPTTNTKFIRNWFGGHQKPSHGQYLALLNSQNQPIVHTDADQSANQSAILWPNSGSDVNYWYNSVGLVPDMSGQIVDVG